MKVEQILQTKGAEVYAVTDTDTVADALGILSDKNIGAVVVKNGAGEVSGILSERDVVRRLKSEGPGVMNSKVGGCMTCDPHTCTPEATVDELMSMMTEKRIRHIPVVNSGKLIGLVSIGDVVKRKIEEAEQEAKALKDYIAS